MFNIKNAMAVLFIGNLKDLKVDEHMLEMPIHMASSTSFKVIPSHIIIKIILINDASRSKIRA